MVNVDYFVKLQLKICFLVVDVGKKKEKKRKKKKNSLQSVYYVQVCVDAKLWVLVGFIFVGMICYFVLETVERKNASDSRADIEAEKEVKDKDKVKNENTQMEKM
jgi:preprotein translocase subunit YajC